MCDCEFFLREFGSEDDEVWICVCLGFGADAKWLSMY